ncbi:MAG: hypothetical protein KDE14_15300 [Rhodobacteraceae bacterium]|nr:hypothetical protein [Paracoccaceae bacterium]
MKFIRTALIALATVATVTIVAMAASPRIAQAETVLRVGTNALPPSLFNPFANTGLPYVYTWSAVFDGLTVIDEHGDVQPWLATSWTNVDPLTWRFELRRDVVFSDGTPMTADAVVATSEYITSPGATRDVVARMMSFIETVRAVDDYTVEFKTKVPTPLLPRFLPQYYVVQPEKFRALGIEGFARAPVATGPFAVEDIAANRVVFKAHTSSWRAPKVDKLEILIVPDAGARRMSVQSGQLDIALNLGPEETASIAGTGGSYVTWRDAAIWAYQFNGTKDERFTFAPFKDIRVREALNIAVDRVAIIDALLDGKTVPATQPAADNVYGFNPDLPPIPYDAERAKRLLAEAGYKNGFDFVIEATVGSSAADAAVHQAVAQYLAAVGVRADVQVITANQLIRNVVEGTWQVPAFGIHYNFEPTAEVLRALDTASCLWAYPWYCNPDVMPLIEQAAVEFDPARNLKLRQDIMAAYRWDWPGIYMYQAVRFAGLRKGVSGLRVVNNFIYFDEIEKR